MAVLQAKLAVCRGIRKMKIDRLMGIVVYLLNHGRTSAQKLAAEFEVSSRTIMRDLESLDQAGIPIQSFCGMEGGYQIMEGFVLEKQAAARYEYDWIVAALKGMASAYANKEIEQVLAKMNSLNIKSLNHAKESAVSIDFSVAGEDGKIKDELLRLEGAIKEKNVVRFLYTNSRDEEKEMEVEPVRLQYKWYSWYLIGYYEKYQDYCMFKLVRMERLEVTDIKNRRNHDLADINLKEDSGPIVEIKLYGKKAVKSKCREYLNGQVTREFENGDFEFCFSAPEHETYWYGVVLSFGNKVKIMKPKKVKERILKVCKEIQMLYEDSV